MISRRLNMSYLWQSIACVGKNLMIWTTLPQTFRAHSHCVTFSIATAILLITTNGFYRTQWKWSHYATATTLPTPEQPIVSKTKSQSQIACSILQRFPPMGLSELLFKYFLRKLSSLSSTDQLNILCCDQMLLTWHTITRLFTSGVNF